MDNITETILLTGGFGYIGSITAVQVYKYLHSEVNQNGKKKYKIAIIDSLINSTFKVKDRINQSIAQEIGQEYDPNQMYFSFHQICLLDQPKLKELFQDYINKNEPIKYIVHFAAKKAVGESVLKPLLYYQNNIIGTINLLQCMEDFNCKNLLYSSSATVYSPGEYLDEESYLKPSNPYGETKICIEYMMKSIQKANGGCVLSLRYFNPVGGSKNGLLGDSPSVFPNNLFPFIEQVAVGNRPQLNIFGKDWPTPDGTGVRDYIHVIDLAEGHVQSLKLIIEKVEKDENWYDYINLGTGKGYSVLQIVESYSKVMGKVLPHQFQPRREGDVAILTANPEKAKKILNWETKQTLDDICFDSYNFILKNANGIQ